MVAWEITTLGISGKECADFVSQDANARMFPETSDAARQVTLRDTMRRDASVKASKTGYVRRTSREKATHG